MPRLREPVDDGVLAEINVIPLVDIVLVLLIIFMLTAPLLQRTIDVRLPRARSGEIQPEERLIISITADGVYYFERQPIRLDQLEAYVREQAGQWKTRAVYVRADARVSYESIVRLLDVLRRYGITRIGLVTRPWTPEPAP